MDDRDTCKFCGSFVYSYWDTFCSNCGKALPLLVLGRETISSETTDEDVPGPTAPPTTKPAAGGTAPPTTKPAAASDCAPGPVVPQNRQIVGQAVEQAVEQAVPQTVGQAARQSVPPVVPQTAALGVSQDSEQLYDSAPDLASAQEIDQQRRLGVSECYNCSSLLYPGTYHECKNCEIRFCRRCAKNGELNDNSLCVQCQEEFLDCEMCGRDVDPCRRDAPRTSDCWVLTVSFEDGEDARYVFVRQPTMEDVLVVTGWDGTSGRFISGMRLELEAAFS